jgi:hypothetical protein
VAGVAAGRSPKQQRPTGGVSGTRTACAASRVAHGTCRSCVSSTSPTVAASEMTSGPNDAVRTSHSTSAGSGAPPGASSLFTRASCATGWQGSLALLRVRRAARSSCCRCFSAVSAASRSGRASRAVAGVARVAACIYRSQLRGAHRGILIPYLGGIPLAALTTGDMQAMFTAVVRDETALGRPVSATLRPLHGRPDCRHLHVRPARNRPHRRRAHRGAAVPGRRPPAGGGKPASRQARKPPLPAWARSARRERPHPA